MSRCEKTHRVTQGGCQKLVKLYAFRNHDSEMAVMRVTLLITTSFRCICLNENLFDSKVKDVSSTWPTSFEWQTK